VRDQQENNDDLGDLDDVAEEDEEHHYDAGLGDRRAFDNAVRDQQENNDDLGDLDDVAEEDEEHHYDAGLGDRRAFDNAVRDRQKSESSATSPSPESLEWAVDKRAEAFAMTNTDAQVFAVKVKVNLLSSTVIQH
jgi:hypothetical protein